MEVLGFTSEDQDSIFRILASILHLGNVYFEKHEVRGNKAGPVHSLSGYTTHACFFCPAWAYSSPMISENSLYVLEKSDNYL